MDLNTECCFNCEHIKVSTDVCSMGEAVESHEWETKKCKNFKMYTIPPKRNVVIN